jgi:hypothetical protein
MHRGLGGPARKTVRKPVISAPYIVCGCSGVLTWNLLQNSGISVPYTVCGWRGISYLELVVELRDPPGNDALEARLESVGAELEAHLKTHVDFSSMLDAEQSS